MPDPVSLDEFSNILATAFTDVLSPAQDIAVGVSGGSDSMALVKLLSEWAAQNDGPQIHALIVDHGLRSESSKEAESVSFALQAFEHVQSSVLLWAGDKPDAAIQEEARRARYDLMSEYCQAQGLEHLFLAHHQDDQAETFLFRLAKGSGLDGLAGMKALQKRGALTLVRPLLDIAKERLIATCESHGLEVIADPSNESDDYARVRLRKSMDVLGKEGLTSKRLSTTAMRLSRARQALEEMTQRAADDIFLENDTDRIVLNSCKFNALPEELALRVVIRAFESSRPNEDYAPRMEKIESLVSDLRAKGSFRKRTLGGLVFERDDKNAQVIVQNEESKNSS